MSRVINRNDALDALADELDDAPAPEPHHIRWKKGWRPRLNPVQEEARKSDAIFILLDGERGSGKTTGAIHYLVEHCYENSTLAFIIVKEVAQATDGGAWHKLMTEILPTWKYGNRDRDGNLLDHGIGIDFGSDGKNQTSLLDPQTKKPYVWLSSKTGWSKIMLMSLPVAHQVTTKAKGKEPSFVVVDEAQTLDSDDYFKMLVQQIGRRPRIKGRQKIIFCCNPAGPSHWLYKRFFVLPANEETGEWDHRYARFHVPVSENLHNLPPRYYEDYVLPAVKGDPVEEARMVRGEWVDRPEGDALFGSDFREQIHVRGDVKSNRGIMPIKGHPIIFSYDLGAAHTSVHVNQLVPTKDKIFRLTIDEFDYVGQYMPYFRLVPKLIQRMQYWDQRVGTAFHFVHVSDDSAFNQYRAKEGSFDAKDIEDLSKAYVDKNGLDERYIIRMVAAPKGKHSVEARVRMTRDGLQQEEVIISATCHKTKEMFMRLEEDPDNRLKPKAGPYLHKFDSYSYGFFYFLVGRGHFTIQTKPVQPQVYAMGA